MNFDNLAHWLIVILWIVSIVGVYSFTRRRGEGETLLTKLFQSNQDLDTTLQIILKGAVVFAVLSIVVVFFSMFHDDLDKGDVGMLAMHVIGMAGTAIAGIVGNGNKQDKPNFQRYDRWHDDWRLFLMDRGVGHVLYDGPR